MAIIFKLISDPMPVEGKGQALIAREVVQHSALAARVAVGDRIELRTPSGEACQAKVNGIEYFRIDPFPEDGLFPLAILVSNDVPQTFCAEGIEVWTVEKGSN